MNSPLHSQKNRSQNNTDENFNKKGFREIKEIQHNKQVDQQGYTTGTLSIANGTQALGLNPSTLRGKIKNIEENAKVISDELSKHKKDFQSLKNEKETLEQVLIVKNKDIQNTLHNEIKRLEEEMKRHYVHQKAESNRIQTQLNNLKADKTSLQQTLNQIEQRINLLESGVGDNEKNN